jgi:putative inorganic carbon (HCO3(-)) transporter
VLLMLVVVPLALWWFSFDACALPKAAAFSVLLLVALLGLLGTRDLRRRWSLLPLREIGPPLAALVVVTGLASALGGAPIKALVGDCQRYRGLLALVAYGVLAMVAAAVAPTGVRRRALLVALVAGSLPVSLYAISQRFGYDPYPWDLSSGREALRVRVFSTLASPSFLGAYLALVLPVGLALLSRASRGVTVLLSAALGMGASALLFTYSRGAWIGAAAGVVFTLISMRWGRIRQVGRPLAAALAVTIVLVALGAGGGPSLVKRAASITDTKQGSAGVRLELWRSALAMIKARPVIGWGPASYRSRLPAFVSGPRPEEQKANPSSHNLILDYGVESGVLGIAAFVWLVVAAWRAARRTGEEGREVAMAASAGLLSYLVTHQFGFPVTGVEVPFWVCLGLAAAAGKQAATNERSPRWRQAALALAAVPVVLLVAVMGRVSAADVRLRSGTMAAAKGEVAVAEPLLCRAAEGALIEFHALQYGWYSQRAKPPDPAAAERAYRRVLELDPFYGPNHGSLARCYLDIGGPAKLAEAVKEAKLAVAHDPYDGDARLTLGLAEERAGRRREAMAAYRKAIAFDPNQAAPYNNLANLYATTGEAEEAERHYRKALTLAPGNASYHHNLALFYLRLDRFGAAREELERAVALDPENEPYRELLRRVCDTMRPRS